MVLRGRPASGVPVKAVEMMLQRLGVEIAGDTQQQDSRGSALGALSGIATGLLIGTAASFARDHGVRLSAPVGAVVTGAAAMAATDVPMALSGISDPRTWTAQDWAVDGIAHLAYGIAVRSVLDQIEPHTEPTRRASVRLIASSAMLGVATGLRSTFAVAGPVLAGRLAHRAGDLVEPASKRATLAATAALGGELIVDKLPATPSRLVPPALGARLAAASAGAVALARRDNADVALPSVAAIAGAAAGSWGGALWREARFGRSWQRALIEDAAGFALAISASWPDRLPSERSNNSSLQVD